MKLFIKFCLLGTLALNVVGLGAESLSSVALKGINFQYYSVADLFTPYSRSLDDGKTLTGPKTKAIVFTFSGTQCGLIKQYVPTLNKLQAEFESKGILFINVYSDDGLATYDIAQHALEYGLNSRVLLDRGGALAQELGASVLTEVFVVNDNFEIIYRGAIDDQYKTTSRLKAPRHHYLRDALASFTQGKTINQSATTPSGCVIESTKERDETVAPVTYYPEIAQIIQNKCQVCHRPGEVGSSYAEFTEYEDFAANSEMIREVVIDRQMPPFYSAGNEKFIEIVNNHMLSKDEIRLIDAWVKTGAQEGDRKLAPPPRSWSTAEWSFSDPDYTTKMEKPFPVPATGTLDYQFFKLKLDFDHDKWVKAVELKPGSAEVVHHMELHIVKADDEDYSGPDGMAKLYGLTGENTQLLSSFVPGDTENNARVFPDGQAMRIPRHHDLVMEIHYTPIGKPVLDQSRVAFRWAKEAPEVELCTHAFRLHRSDLKIPAYDGHVELQKAAWFRKDVNLLSIRAHMHQIGKSWRLDWMHDAGDGTFVPEFMAGIPSWDFNWQRTLDFKDPILVPAGQELMMTGIWDNSSYNFANPEPEKTKIWGLQSSDEMLSMRVLYTVVQKEGQSSRCKDAAP